MTEDRLQQTFKVGKRKVEVEVYADEVVASIRGEAIVSTEYAVLDIDGDTPTLTQAIVMVVQGAVEVANDAEQARVDAARAEADRIERQRRAFADARRALGA